MRGRVEIICVDEGSKHVFGVDCKYLHDKGRQKILYIWDIWHCNDQSLIIY